MRMLIAAGALALGNAGAWFAIFRFVGIPADIAGTIAILKFVASLLFLLFFMGRPREDETDVR